MSILQDMQLESGLLTVEAQGEFSLEAARRAFLETLGAVAHYHAEKGLVDGRNLKGKPEDIERFCYGEFAARQTMRLVQKHRMVPRFAYVINRPLRDPRRFAETVAVNRGMIVKVVETPEDAFQWFEFQPTNRMQVKIEKRLNSSFSRFVTRDPQNPSATG